jgi:hypothetical protein
MIVLLVVVNEFVDYLWFSITYGCGVLVLVDYFRITCGCGLVVTKVYLDLCL